MLQLLACAPGSIATGPGADSAPESSPSRPDGDSVELVPGETGRETGEAPDGGDPEGDIWDPLAVVPLTLTVESAAYRDLQRDGGTYAEATLGWDDWTGPVMIHVKGSSTWQSIGEKPSLVVDVNRVEPDQEFFGLKKFYLHNQMYDPSMMSEALSYGFYRAWGYPASRTTYVRLALNGDDYGLYSMIEAHNDDFLQTWFPDDADGNLYENGEAYCDVGDIRCMELEESDEGSDEALERLGDAVAGGDFATDVAPLLDYEQFVAYLALEAVIVHWDSYSYDLSNFKLYHRPIADRWTLLTQSMDLDYGWRPWSYDACGMYGMDVDNYVMGDLARLCQTDETCHAAFVDAVEQYADALEAADGAAQVLALDAVIEEEVKSDPRRYYGNRDYDEHVECLQGFFADRPGQLRAWAADERGRWF